MICSLNQCICAVLYTRKASDVSGAFIKIIIIAIAITLNIFDHELVSILL